MNGEDRAVFEEAFRWAVSESHKRTNRSENMSTRQYLRIKVLKVLIQNEASRQLKDACMDEMKTEEQIKATAARLGLEVNLHE